jgi:hypothetical protein
MENPTVCFALAAFYLMRAGRRHACQARGRAAKLEVAAVAPAALAGKRGRLAEKALIVDLLDQEVCHVGAGDEPGGPVARID